MKKTFKEFRELDATVGVLYKKYPKLQETKFGYAYKRVQKPYSDLVAILMEELQEIEVKNALVDPTTKALLYEENARADANPNIPKKFKFSKEGKLAQMKESKELGEKYDIKEIDIEPFIVKPEDLPENIIFTEEQKEILGGVLI